MTNQSIPDRDTVRNFLSAVVESGSIFEVRVPKTRSGGPSRFSSGKTSGGFFDTIEAATEAVCCITGDDAPGVYVTINPLASYTLNWGANRLAVTSRAAADADVIRLRTLYLDFDPIRPADTNATDDERHLAKARMLACCDYLRDLGWPDPLWQGGSGSGGMLLYRIDLPREDKRLVESVLQTLSALFSDDSVKLDTSVGNPARIARVAGTVNAKSPTPQEDRPWRTAKGKGNPGAGIVTREQLRALVGPEPNATPRTPTDGPSFDLGAVLRDSDIAVKRKKQTTYGMVFEVDCLTSDAHRDGACFIQFASGAAAYRCLHDSCGGKGWQDVKALLDLPERPQSRPTASNAPLSHPATSAPAEWGEPLPLTVRERPPFPLHSLPVTVRDLVAGVAEETQTPPDLAAIMALGTISAAVGGKYVVRANGNWEEPVHIHTACCLESGNRKSGVLRVVTAPLHRFERERAKDERKDRADWESEDRIRRAQLAQLENSLSKHDADKATDLARRDLLLQIEQKRAPRITQLVTDDATPERVKQMLAEQGGALAIISPESAFFGTLAGKYTKDGAPALDLLLAGHAGDTIRVSRMGRDGEYIPRPSLTVCCAPQPSVIRDLGKVHGFRERGCAARLLAAFPESPLGRRKLDPRPCSPAVLDNWERLIRSLVLRPRNPETDEDGYHAPWVIQLSPHARDELTKFQHWAEPQFLAGGAFDGMSDWGSKLAGACLRLAGLLHLTEHDHTLPIEAKTMRAGIAFGHYFLAHARIMFDLLTGRNDAQDAFDVLDAIRALGSPTTKRDLHRKLRGQTRFATADKLDAPLRLLTDHDCARLRDERQNGGNRPSTVIELNPACIQQHMDNRDNRQRSSPIVPIVHAEPQSEPPHHPPVTSNIGAAHDPWDSEPVTIGADTTAAAGGTIWTEGAI